MEGTRSPNSSREMYAWLTPGTESARCERPRSRRRRWMRSQTVSDPGPTTRASFRACLHPSRPVRPDEGLEFAPPFVARSPKQVEGGDPVKLKAYTLVAVLAAFAGLFANTGWGP